MRAMGPNQPESVAAVSYVDDSFPLGAQTGELLAPCHHRRREKDARCETFLARAGRCRALSAGWQQIRENKYQHLILRDKIARDEKGADNRI